MEIKIDEIKKVSLELADFIAAKFPVKDGGRYVDSAELDNADWDTVDAITQLVDSFPALVGEAGDEELVNVLDIGGYLLAYMASDGDDWSSLVASGPKLDFCECKICPSLLLDWDLTDIEAEKVLAYLQERIPGLRLRRGDAGKNSECVNQVLWDHLLSDNNLVDEVRVVLRR